MSMIFNPKYRDMPSQVQKNKNDIEMLKTRLKDVYYTTDFKDDDSDTMTIFVSHTNFPLLDFSDPEVVAEFIPSAYIITGNSYLMKVTSISYNPTVHTSVAIAELVCDIQGADGEPGRDGQNATSLSLGTVTEGDEASATLTPTGDGVYTLDLVLPRGEQGDPGEPGEDGERGPAGPQGPKGDDATSLSIGTVTNVPYGDPATASLTSDGDGNYTLDMEIPEGPAPDLSPGLVDSLPYGYEPTINITYDGTGYVLDMGIPEGAPGQNGQDGTDGVDGTNAEIVGVSATVDNNTGVPYVDVYNQGTSEQADFLFEFHNLKGEPGGGGAEINKFNSAKTTGIALKSVTWNINPFGGLVWTDGTNTYYSNANAFANYVLNKDTNQWDSVTWTGMSAIKGNEIWTDGSTIYYSDSSAQYYLSDPENHTWDYKSWFGTQPSEGYNVWTDGTHIYYSNGTTQTYLGGQYNNSWITASWLGLTNFNGDFIWSDGEHIYYSNGTGNHYELTGPFAWTQKSWGSGFTNFYGNGIWTDGNNIYYSSSDTYVLDKNSQEFVLVDYSNFNLTSPNINIAGSDAWTDGNNIYFSDGSSGGNYVLSTFSTKCKPRLK